MVQLEPAVSTLSESEYSLPGRLCGSLFLFQSTPWFLVLWRCPSAVTGARDPSLKLPLGDSCAVCERMLEAWCWAELGLGFSLDRST